MAHKGKFKPVNKLKYKGDWTSIVYRSSWELSLMRYCDKHPDIIQWSSEEVIVPYRSPIDGRMHRYYPDFIVTKRNKNNKISTIMIEVKPKHQTRPPDPSKSKTPKGRMSRQYLNEVKTWGVNEAKWKAAIKFCEERGWAFQIFTEDNIGIKK